MLLLAKLRRNELLILFGLFVFIRRHCDSWYGACWI